MCFSPFSDFIRKQEGDYTVYVLHYKPYAYSRSFQGKNYNRCRYFVTYGDNPFTLDVGVSTSRQIADIQCNSSRDYMILKVKRPNGITVDASLGRHVKHEFLPASTDKPEKFKALNDEAMAIDGRLWEMSRNLGASDLNDVRNLLDVLDFAYKSNAEYPDKELCEYHAITGFNKPPQHLPAYQEALKCFSFNEKKADLIVVKKPPDVTDELYDAFQKRDHVTVALLLPKYKEATGKDKPGFMI